MGIYLYFAKCFRGTVYPTLGFLGNTLNAKNVSRARAKKTRLGNINYITFQAKWIELQQFRMFGYQI